MEQNLNDTDGFAFRDVVAAIVDPVDARAACDHRHDDKAIARDNIQHLLVSTG